MGWWPRSFLWSQLFMYELKIPGEMFHPTLTVEHAFRRTSM